MICFDIDAFRFQVRAAAIVIHNDCLLIHRAPSDPFWALPGGRVEPGENAALTVVRELREEIDVTARVDRLIFLVENFFDYAGRKHHEIGLYFAVHLEEDAPLLDTTGRHTGYEPDTELIFRWIERERLPAFDIRPSFLSEALSQPDLQFRHIVHHDIDSNQAI